MHVAGPYKTLFSYREYTHPYEGLMRALIGGGGFHRWEIMPPLSGEVGASIGRIKQLMGIRYVLSLDEIIDSPHLIYRGACESPPVPSHIYSDAALPDLIEYWSEVGPVHVYEVAEPTGVAFLVDNYKKVEISESLKAIYENSEQPWNENTVYLEDEPPQASLTAVPLEDYSCQEGNSTIVSESYSRAEIQVIAPREKFLVLSYLHRPFYRAQLNGIRVPVLRAYGGFMCVKVPPGKHIVTFRYYPIDLYVGIALTLLALVAPFGVRRML